MSQDAPAPFQQGALDALCAFYAIINATRLAAPAGRVLSQHASRSLFRAMAKGAQKRRLLLDMLTDGVSPEELEQLLGDAARWLARARLTLTWHRPFADLEAVPLEDWLRCVDQHLDQPSRSVIVSIGGALDHWSVVRRVGSVSITLADSTGRRQLMITACEAGLDQEDARYRLPPCALFLLDLAVTDN
ncbi:hypothetical protein [Azospirillum sp.]|uniref:hypothetical protein n=1 Tax=Azospirillum sp. TaxID=34012 RepID=UPI002D718375|nr:hypothetical protein [Azospirillum sp.]HYD64145.1 hypothetical protein [Azospirillum sp.]